jgi:hypothetical protein
MKLIIERFEGDTAVVEVGNRIVNVPRVIIPDGAKEGSVISVEVDAEYTSKRKKKIDNIMNDLWQD